jgi:hypothetical protein
VGAASSRDQIASKYPIISRLARGEPFDPESFDPESFDPELTAEGLTAEGLTAEWLSRIEANQTPLLALLIYGIPDYKRHNR